MDVSFPGAGPCTTRASILMSAPPNHLRTSWITTSCSVMASGRALLPRVANAVSGWLSRSTAARVMSSSGLVSWMSHGLLLMEPP